MKIKTKMLLGGGFLAAVPILISSLFIGITAVNQGKSSLEQSAQKSLTAIRDITASQIHNYITGIENQAQSLSENLMTIEAMEAFDSSFHGYISQLPVADISQKKVNLMQYYEGQFGTEFSEQNSQAAPINDLISSLDDTAVAFQYDFISNNPNPLGNKHLLSTVNNSTEYAAYHQKYHAVFKRFIERFGYYDLFLVDHNSGDIVYSVFKELDYATSLINGPYANSGIGEAFALANEASESGFTGLTDFAPYLPSYNAPASFIGAPIFNENGKKLGVLILQMPVDRINELMTYGQNWEDSGLGLSGETYLVGQDYTMRSNGRFLLEDKQRYLSLMTELGLPQKTITTIDSKSTSIGLQPVKTTGTERALAGESGFDIFADYRNISVLSAYKPLKINRLNWAIMSEIDEEEAFSAVSDLREKVIYVTAIVIVLALIFGPVIAWLIALAILKPISTLVGAMHNLSDGEGDLTQRVNASSNDEVSELASYINKFIHHLDITFSELIKSAMRLVPMSEELTDGNNNIRSASEEQQHQISKVKERISAARESTERVSEESSAILLESNTGVETVQEGIRVFDSTYAQIRNLGDILGNASHSINTLKSESDKIVNVIDVINSIAEQTNLLALNAAIEAARAGEAGRGFAVVADEVRALASRTRESTLEVSSMVESIQTGTLKVVDTMALGLSSTEACNEQVGDAKANLSSISDVMTIINTRADSISSAVVEQKDSFYHVAADFEALDECFHNSQKASKISVQIGIDMNKMSEKIYSMVQGFKLTDNDWSPKPRNKVRIEE